jgi:uncharacterized integral membrane protein
LVVMRLAGHWRRVVAANRAATCELMLLMMHSVQNTETTQFRYTTGTNKTTT